MECGEEYVRPTLVQCATSMQQCRNHRIDTIHFSTRAACVCSWSFARVTRAALTELLACTTLDMSDNKPVATTSEAPSPYECNICLETAAEPVVTYCGHLYCWPCLYRWLRSHANCPVCKASVTRETVIPLYGRGGERADPRGRYEQPVSMLHQMNAGASTVLMFPGAAKETARS